MNSRFPKDDDASSSITQTYGKWNLSVIERFQFSRPWTAVPEASRHIWGHPFPPAPSCILRLPADTCKGPKGSESLWARTAGLNAAVTWGRRIGK